MLASLFFLTNILYVSFPHKKVLLPQKVLLELKIYIVDQKTNELRISKNTLGRQVT